MHLYYLHNEICLSSIFILQQIYSFHCLFLQFLRYIIIIETKVLLSQAYVTLPEFAYPV